MPPMFYSEDSNDDFLKNIRFFNVQLILYMYTFSENKKASLRLSNSFLKLTRFFIFHIIRHITAT